MPQQIYRSGPPARNNEADIIADAKSLPVESNSVDVVLCNQVIEHSRSKLERSTVATDDGLVPDKDRTSHGTWIAHSDFPEVCQRVADIAAIPLERAEPINVLRYTNDQEYKPHYDALDGVHLENGGQRLLTCLVYLNNAVGGSTAFPKLNLIVGSIGGRLLMFGNVDENNQAHDLSLHQGLPPHFET